MKYNVIKAFGSAKVGDVFYPIMEDGKVCDWYMESESDGGKDMYYWGSYRSMQISNRMADLYEDQGYLELVEDVKEVTEAERKIKELEEFITKMSVQYQDKLVEINEAYSRGELQECVKLESETVYYNMIKLLDKISDLIYIKGDE